MTSLMVEIRDELPNDYVAIREVHVRASDDDKAANLVELLRKRKKASIALIALIDDHVVGHVMFSPIVVAKAPEDFRGIALAPLAVLPQFQNRGIGSKLSYAGLEACRQATMQLSSWAHKILSTLWVFQGKGPRPGQ